MADGTITSVDGVSVGHYTDTDAMTGVTAISFPEPNVGIVDVRGGAPGTRELAIFGDAIKPVTVNALVFAGGSAFGLAAAQGVVEELESEGRGAPTPTGPVPIVPTVILYDLMVGKSDVRPTADDGRTAYLQRSTDPVAMGSVGAGTGATVGKLAGIEHASKGGIGSASVCVGEATVGALVALNAVGDVFSLSGVRLTGSRETDQLARQNPGFAQSTTLIAIATDAILDRNEMRRMAVRAHDALGATIRPAHTRYDGDTAFVVSNEVHEAAVDGIVEAAFEVVASSIMAAIEWAGAR
ncbi:MAG: P1 family peptidase [Acidimicrobiia bacterium]|nr:MAG: P1 family peptidase [Acidimicrobiia bacterium]